ncbi:unnamed protein product [Adineta steineri]|uniref:EGF-like domain-containing protein n=1 Tax=Adineta steineri TaxID=433720 RepID=A0A814Y5U4_9BILA|nr:unnamed protein product [Adineta steineri]
MCSLLRLSNEDDIHQWMIYSKDETRTECFIINFRYYCRSVTVNTIIESCKDGNAWTFDQLENLNVTTENLMDWLIPFHVIEQYAAYLDDNENTRATEATICNCSRNRIGRYCEYNFISRVMLPGNLLAQQMSKMFSNSYETLTRFVDGIICPGADMFLEWRHICDGFTQCTNGADELDCHLLEFFKCETDEFQCRNGMCIPVEFAFDATPDCMDSSDEQALDELYKRFQNCAVQSTSECDNRLCHKDQFSCGNGESIPWSAILNDQKDCGNFRDLAYICEISHVVLVTLGQWPGICKQTMELVPPLTNSSDCRQTLGHLLQTEPFQQLSELAVINLRTRCENSILYFEQNAFFPDRVSLRRINDGYTDCLYGDDERNPDYPMTQLFRYQCQTVTSPSQYVTYAKLGDGVDDCADGSDEVSKEIRWSTFKCDASDNYACWAFQGDQFGENRLKDARLHFHRYCDSIWDVMDGRDEKNCSDWICDSDLYKCNRTGQCIERKYFCDGEFDCDDGEDEVNCSLPWIPWNLEVKCNKSTEFFCITDDYVKNQSLNRSCIHRSRVGDEHIDCIGARDERNVASCPDHRMVGDRFLCDNGRKCIDYMAVCNGIKDCVDETDESICYWNTGYCPAGQFSCADQKGCKRTRCTAEITCNDKSHRFWCPNSTSENYVYRSSKDRSVIDNKKRCYNQLESQTKLTIASSSSNRQVKALADPYFYCNRGFYLQAATSSEFLCFCPPTFYGDRCQYNSRRISILVRFDRGHRPDLSFILNVLVTLVLNGSTVVDHRFFLDEAKEYSSKSLTYLIYPRPKPLGIYSVRIETYNSTKLIHFWEYPVSPLDFLPVLRIAKVLRFPTRSFPWFCSHNYCENNGTCHQREDNRFLCICVYGWKGKLCEMRTEHIHCASHSLARTETICVCPQGYLEPYCYVQNQQCQQHNCERNKTCIPRSHPPIYGYTCICNTSKCDINRAVISLHRQESNQSPFLLQLLQLTGDYPTIRQQILVQPLTSFPLIQTIKTRDGTYEIGEQPEIGLLFTFESNAHSIESTLYLLFINCSNAMRNFSVDLDQQLNKCHVLPENQKHAVALFGNFCQSFTYGTCFISDGYLCYCGYPNKNHSNCLSYQRRYTWYARVCPCSCPLSTMSLCG